jgi:arabinose-5-phosphate isomerase
MATQSLEPVPESALEQALKVLALEGQAILKCGERLRAPQAAEQFRRALACLKSSLENGGKIVVTGIGKSGKVGQKIAATFCSTGSLAVFLHPTEGLHGDLGLVAPRDTLLALSYTGNTEELIRLVPPVRELGVPIIGIGGNPQSRLAQSCTAWIDAAVEQEACPHNLAPTSSTTLALAVGDALAIALMQLRGFDPVGFAANHPGGVLGRRLLLKVDEVMHVGDAVAVVRPEATMDEVVIQSTQKKLGAVLVTEGNRLLGIVTDGDLRRALQHRERFFRFSAREVMTARPVTIAPGSLAKDALALMENRPSQISVLPVVDAEGNWKGLLRLHDLVQLL